MLDTQRMGAYILATPPSSSGGSMNRSLLFILIALCGIAPAGAQFTDSLTYADPAKRTLFENPYGWGYIAGTNEYGDIGKYQRFDVFDAPYLAAARIRFGLVRIVGAPDTITVVVRDGEPAGPGSLLTSVTVTTDQLDTTGAGNLFVFPTRPQFQGETFITDSLYIGIEWSEAVDDTFALFADSNGYGDLLQRVWEQIFYNNQWQMWPWYNSPDPSFEWALDSDLWITAYLAATATDVEAGDAAIPGLCVLHQNFPNPFNPATTIRYTIGQPPTGEGPRLVRLAVFDMLGREVAVLVHDEHPAGTYAVQFNAEGLSSGVYLYRLEAGRFSQTRCLALVR